MERTEADLCRAQKAGTLSPVFCQGPASCPRPPRTPSVGRHSRTAGPWGATAAAGQALAAAPPRWDGPTRLEVRILRREAEEALGERRP
jgi:hypothetical protein